MTRVGLVGGLGPESTIDYYRRLLAEWGRYRPDSSPAIVIDSLDVQVGLKLAASDLPGLAEYLRQSVARLAGAGVDFVAITANTGHLVFDELAAQSPVPLLSIVEICADEAQTRGLSRLALLGTRFTMEAPFYPAVFARRGITIVAPGADERRWIHDRYVSQLLKGDFREETRAGVLAIIARLRDEEHVDGVIYGGTELPLLLTGGTVAGLPRSDLPDQNDRGEQRDRKGRDRKGRDRKERAHKERVPRPASRAPRPAPRAPHPEPRIPSPAPRPAPG